ncbi:MAG: histidine phosphatase family protein [Betaproteobacteria bacterium]|nr:histidine phosphatase family protein [Betaproteobacteria bacterium]
MNVNRIRSTLIFACASLAPPWMSAPALAQDQPVSIFIVRHAESDNKLPTVPLTRKGMERAALLAPTVRGIKFTHLFASHTTRARQMLEEVSATSRLPIVQLPTPGSTLDGQVVNDQTTRRAPIEPISDALLKLPPGSVALVALNSENIYAILNKLGVPVAKAGQGCEPGSTCVPCTDNSCYPRDEYNHLWHVVRVPGRAEPVAFAELRYGEGWKPANP